MEVVRKLLNNERGMVMAISLLILALLLGAGVGAIVSTQTDLKTSANVKAGTQAFYIAEAGLHHAWQELADNDGTSDFASISLTLNSLTAFFTSTSFGGGTYKVDLTLVSNSPRIIQITSTGEISRAARVVRARVQQGSVPPESSLITNGNLLVSGNVKFKGTCGGAHSNNNMTLGNSMAQMADGFTSSGTMDVSGTPCIGSTACFEPSQPEQYVLSTTEKKDQYEATHENQLQQPLPTVNPADFAQRVANLGEAGRGYILNDDGTVTRGGTCGSNGLCEGGTGVTPIPDGWSWDGTRWKVSGNSAAHGVFYAETPVSIGGSPGTTTTPWQATIIARDSIEWGGTPKVKPYPTSDTQLQGIQIVTGNDLKIAGDIGLSGHGGAVLVHQQIGFSGNPTIYGYVFAGNGTPTWSGDPFATDTSGYNHFSEQSVSGNPTIHYECNSVPCNHPACRIPKVKMVAGSWSES